MNYSDNDPREDRPADSDREFLVPAVPEPLALPTPEPLVAAEPPPLTSVPSQSVSDLVRPEPSWRTLVAASRATHGDTTPAATSQTGGGGPYDVQAGLLSAGEMPPVQASFATDVPPGQDAGSEGDPGAVATPLVAAGSGTDAQVVRRDSGVTLSRVGEELFAWLKTLASAAVYATLIVTFGFQVARVEGQSMAPTLENQDRLIVNKLAYRLGQPRVGDIVMLYYPLNPDKSFVKRVIAEEGDQIRIVDGRVYRNDVPLNDDYVPPEYRSHDDWGPEVVPQGYYFVMGDHRNNSSDSRHWRFVPKKYIIGKVQLRWWPLPQARIF